MIRSVLITGLVASTLALASCATPRYQMQANCPIDRADLIAGLTALVSQEGMNVTLVNEKVGILQASTAEEHSIWTGAWTSYAWQFNVSNDTIYAFAKQISRSTNVVGANVSVTEMSLWDKNMGKGDDHPWYWNVRNGIQSLCENAVITWVKKAK